MLTTFIRYNFVKTRIELLFILILISLTSFAQQAMNVDFEDFKKSLQYERETIFINALHLSVSQAAVFHPIYVEYNNEKKVLDELLIKLFVQYDELDHKLMHDFIKLSEEHTKKGARVRNKYYRKLSKSISTELASQFYEVDDFISTILRLKILTGLPFMSSIVKLDQK